MKLGYFTMPLHPPGRDWRQTLAEDREAILFAEQLGFEEAFVGEHVTDTAETITSCLIFLATLARDTKRIRLGSGTVNLANRHPAVTALGRPRGDAALDGIDGRRSDPARQPRTKGDPMSLNIRRLQILKDVLFAEAGAAAPQPITRAAALAVIANPFAGRHVQDLSPLFDFGLQIGEQVMPQLVAALAGPAVSYGKGAIVGVNGDMEHGGAICHPKMGKPVRAAVGGGEALIPANVKVAPAGATLDVPISHKDNVWSFEHFDTITVGVADAPRPDEIVVVIVVADGGRVNPRVGKGRIL